MKPLTSRLVVVFLFSILAVSYAVTSTSKQPLMPIRENPGSLPILVSLDDVSKDLHLTSLQKSVVVGLRSDYRSAAKKLMKAHHETSVEIAEAQKKLEYLSLSYNQRVIDILTPAQRLRLREIERQILGGILLVAPSEQKLLRLSEEQKKKIEKILQDSYRKAMNIDLRANQGKLNYHRQILALRNNRKKHGEVMLKVLTREQRKVWEASQGSKLVRTPLS